MVRANDARARHLQESHFVLAPAALPLTLQLDSRCCLPHHGCHVLLDPAPVGLYVVSRRTGFGSRIRDGQRQPQGRRCSCGLIHGWIRTLEQPQKLTAAQKGFAHRAL